MDGAVYLLRKNAHDFAPFLLFKSCVSFLDTRRDASTHDFYVF